MQYLPVVSDSSSIFGTLPMTEMPLFGTATRIAEEYIQLPIQLVSRAISTGVKRLEREADYSSLSSVELQNHPPVQCLMKDTKKLTFTPAMWATFYTQVQLYSVPKNTYIYYNTEY